MGFDWDLQAAIQKVAEQDTISIEDINKLFESFSVKSVLESKELPNGQTLMMYLCRSDQMTVPMMQLFIDEAKKISDENNSNNNNNNNEFLKKQLEFALRRHSSDEYNEVPFISVACAGTTSSLPVIRLIFTTCTEEFGKEWLLQQLQLGFGSNRSVYKSEKLRAIRWICKHARSVDVVRFVFNTFLEIGGKAELEKELDTVDDKVDYKSALTDICSSKSCSVEMAQLVMDQYSAVGGEEFLKKHLLLETHRISALARVGRSSCPDSVFDFFLTKIGDICGESTLKQQLTNTRTNPFTHVCEKVKAENVGHAKLMISKILQICGKETLKKCLQSDATTGFLYSVLKDSKSVEMLQLLLDIVKDNFGMEFATSYFLNEDLFAGANWLYIIVEDEKSTARLELAIRTTLELGGSEKMKKFLQSYNSGMRSPLLNLCNFLAGDKGVPEKKLQLVFDQILSVGGEEFLKEQLEAVDSRDGLTGLHCACRMSDYRASLSCATETVKMLIDAIVNVGGNEFLKKMFAKETSKPETSNLVAFLFHEGVRPRIEVVEIVLAKIVDIGDAKPLLRSYLNIVDKDGKPPLSFVSKDHGKFFVAVLIKLDLFQGQYAKLDDAAKEELKKKTEIDSDEWQPSEELKNRIAKLLMTKEEHDAAAAAKKKADEEAAAAAKKKAEEEAAAAKKKADEEAAAAAKKKAEEEAAAAAKKKAEEEAAAAAKKKADEEAAAAAKKKADEEAAAAAKKKAEEEAAAAAKKKADEEAAAAKKKADEEAAAAAKKKAEGQAAAGRTLKFVVVGGLLAAVAGIALFSLNKHN